jgi:hypothetical protein
MQRAHLGGPAPIPRIVHPTHLSAASRVAFAHALKLALAAGAELDLLHVSAKGGKPDWTEFPGAVLAAPAGSRAMRRLFPRASGTVARRG